MSAKRIIITFLFFLFFFISALPGRSLCHAGLTLEGQFMKNGEKLKTEQPVNMTVRIYNDEFGGQLLFEENQDVVAGSDKAVFAFEQGNVTVRQRTSGLNTADLWVEVESDGQVMTPRLKLTKIDTVNDLTGESIQLNNASLRTGGTATLLIDENGVTLGNLLNMGSQSIKLGGVDRNTWPAGGSSAETDPTVLESVKDGVSWAEVTGKPSVIGDITSITAGTGLNGGGSAGDVTMNINVPLSIPGAFRATSDHVAIVGSSNGDNGQGVWGSAYGSTGHGVHGVAENTSPTVENYGGYFTAAGGQGRGVYGEASLIGLQRNYGGYFKTAGDLGEAVHGEASATEGKNYGGNFSAAGDEGLGVYAIAGNHGAVENYGGWFLARGTKGRGVYGEARNSMSGEKFGGYFLAAGEESRGVYGEAENYGGYFRALGSGGQGIYGEAANTGTVENYGGYFTAAGAKGRGVYGMAFSVDPGEKFGGYFLAAGAEGRGVYGEAITSGAVRNYGGYFKANGETGRGVYGEAAATGNVQNYGGYFKAQGNTGRGVYGYATGTSGRGVKGFANGTKGVGVEGYSDHGIGVRGVGATYDFYAGGAGTNYGPFTGGHDVCLKTGLESEIKPGMIVSVSGQVEKRLTESGKISLSSTLPTVILADQPQDKAIFGVLVSESSFPDNHWYKAREDEHLGIVNALGEGRMWVSNINGEIEVGDYVTSSVLPGYGQLQDDDLIHSYTVGKAIETVDWETVTESITYKGELIKVYLIAVVYTSG